MAIVARLRIDNDRNRYGVYYLRSKKTVWCKDYTDACRKIDLANTRNRIKNDPQRNR